MTGWMELPNQDKIRMLGENETCKYLGILEADTIKQVEMKDKIQKEYLMRTRKLLETKLSSRYLIKGINTWAVLRVGYSGPLLKWTRDELKQMDQRTRKLMTMHKASQRWRWQIICIKKRERKRTCQYRRQRWRVDTMARRLLLRYQNQSYQGENEWRNKISYVRYVVIKTKRSIS